MITLIYIFLGLISIPISRTKFGKRITPYTVFNLIFASAGAISTLGILNLRVPSFEVQLQFICFQILFGIFFLTMSSKRRQSNYYKEIKVIKPSQCIYNNSIAYTLEVVAVILLSTILFRAVGVLVTTGSLTAVRGTYYDSNSYSSVLASFVLRRIPVGILEGLIIYFIYCFVEQNNKKYLGIAAFNALMITISNGGRYAIQLFLYSILILYITGVAGNFSDITISERQKKILKKSFIVLAALLLIVTFYRGQEIAKSLLVYFEGGFSFYDYIYNNGASFALTDHLNGYLTFGAIIEPIVLILKALGLTAVKIPAYYFDMYFQSYYNIASVGRVMFNNNTTVLYYFVRDFGVLGIGVGAAFLATIIALCERKMNRGSRFYAMLYIYFWYVMFNAIMDYSFFGQTPIIIIGTLFICTKNIRIVFGRTGR